MNTLQQALHNSLGAKYFPVRTNKSLTVQRLIMQKAPIGKIANSTRTTITEREPENYNNSWNGGDYWFGTEYIDRFWFSRTSCELSMDNTEYIAGYFKCRPVVAQVSDWWAADYADGVSLAFQDGSYLKCDHKEWDKIIESPDWDTIGSSCIGAGFTVLNK